MGWVDDLRAACTVRSSEHLPPLSLDEYVPVIPDEELDIFNTLIAAGIQKTKEIPRLSLKRNNGTNIGSLLRKEAHALRIRKLRQETLTPADHHLLHDVLHSAFIPNCGYEVVEEPRIPENDVGLENGASSALMPAAQEETRQEETVIIIEEEDWGEINVGNGVAGSEMDVQPPKILSYAEFKSAKDQLPERFGQYFRPSIFLRLSHDGGDHILACRFQVYVERKATLTLERAEIAAHDEDCDGFITEPELAEYIGDLLPKLHVGQMSENYVRFYLCTATRKFFFFLDPLKLRKIKIERIVLSPIMTELMSLKDEPLSPTSISANWFSSVSTFRLYYQFLELDSDKSGLLDQAELSEYCPTMTSVFIDRVFQEHQTFRGQMDFGNFLDFVLAHENQDTPEAMAYFFKILDINGMGGLDHFTVRYFFKAVNDKMLESGYEPVYVEDVTNEIFDMARPKNEDFITLEDLQKCGCGSTIITMLSDSRGFYLYDNRESIDPSSDDA